MISRMATALYDYATLRTAATWDGNRPGFSVPNIGVCVKSCGAFRRWEILCHDGRVCFSVDGYRHGSGCETGRVGVLVGDGHFFCPDDNSRTDHSLEMECSEGSTIVWVKPEDDIPCEERLVQMCEQLEKGYAELKAAIDEYDEKKRIQIQEQRRSLVQDARNALS